MERGDYSFKSFVDQDLSHQDLSHSQFIQCDFTGANLEEANCSFSAFNGSNFTDANLRYTNFARSNLTGITFYPRDAYGVIFSLECTTFKDFKLSRLWWYSYIFFGLMQIPETEGGIDPRDGIIAHIGATRYKKLCTMFERRGV